MLDGIWAVLLQTVGSVPLKKAFAMANPGCVNLYVAKRAGDCTGLWRTTCRAALLGVQIRATALPVRC